jgi:hypothetical protein
MWSGAVEMPASRAEGLWRKGGTVESVVAEVARAHGGEYGR